MPSIWRPNVRVTLDEDGEVEDTEQGGEEVTKKGTKRKGAPRTKGPCEHGVKPRSQCKVCSACPHGKSAVLSVGGAICKAAALCAAGVSNLRARSSALFRARSAVGRKSASTVVGAQGVRWGLNLRARSSALSVQGVRWGLNLRARS